MRTRFKLSSAFVACAMLAFAAPAVAANPSQDAYGGVNSITTSGTLPFTGINVGAVLAVALVLVATGLLLRRRAAASSN